MSHFGGYTLSHDRAHVHHSPELYAKCHTVLSLGKWDLQGDMLAIIALLSMVGLAWRITRADIQHYKSQRCVEGIAEYLVDRTYKASSYIHIVPEERSSQCFHCHEAPFFCT